MHVNFMKYKWVYFGISLAILIPGLLSLIFYGLRPSIDFTGGTLLEIQTPAKNFSEVAKNQNLELSSVQPSADNTYLLRFKTLDKDQNEKFKSALGPDLIEKRYESVGPIVGAEMTKKALLAVALASIAIVIYIAWSFRGVPKPYSSWKFGVSAVAALLHDALVVLGIFSILGHFSEIVDFSLTETLVRSLNTSLTVILTLTALLLFGGETIRWFVVALLVGIISGTYSSIFNAAPLLVLWESHRPRSTS